MKKCNDCAIEKRLEMFSKDKYISDGHKNKCKDCEKKNRDLKQGRPVKKNVNNCHDAKIWLKENFPQYEIISFGPPVTLFNINKNSNFEYSSFPRFKEKILKNPNREFGISKKDLQEKIKKTNSEKYGGPSPFCSAEIRQKSKKSILEKYNVENVMHSKKFVLERMTKHVFDGKTVSEITSESGTSYSHFINVLNSQGIEAALNLKKGMTSIEIFISSLLSENKVEFVFNQWHEDTKTRPDFLIDNKLVIEADGLRWHCDLFCANKKYHAQRSNKFASANIDSLFFRSDEILNKPNVVKSIILNKLKLNKEKIFARKCKIQNLNNQEASVFFQENHLMGNGSGRTYALKFGEETVAAIQVRWISKKESLLDISRFCTKNGTSVVGGYSKLISHIEKIEQPKAIQTFVDKRYGDGSYLKKFGFELKNEDLSFCWTDFKNTYHRMNFPGNSGYDKGLYKIWDCGQAKWVKEIQKTS